MLKPNFLLGKKKVLSQASDLLISKLSKNLLKTYDFSGNESCWY